MNYSIFISGFLFGIATTILIRMIVSTIKEIINDKKIETKYMIKEAISTELSSEHFKAVVTTAVAKLCEEKNHINDSIANKS